MMWTITEDSFQPDELHHKETLFTTGNGYLATRGTFEEGYPDDRRTTFIHGVFDEVPIFFTELANAPDWLPLEISIDGERFSLDSGMIRHYARSLDLRTGVLRREVSWTSPSGKGLELIFERFASLADEHLVYMRCQIIPEVEGRTPSRTLQEQWGGGRTKSVQVTSHRTHSLPRSKNTRDVTRSVQALPPLRLAGPLTAFPWRSWQARLPHPEKTIRDRGEGREERDAPLPLAQNAPLASPPPPNTNQFGGGEREGGITPSRTLQEQWGGGYTLERHSGTASQKALLALQEQWGAGSLDQGAKYVSAEEEISLTTFAIQIATGWGEHPALAMTMRGGGREEEGEREGRQPPPASPITQRQGDRGGVTHGGGEGGNAPAPSRTLQESPSYLPHPDKTVRDRGGEKEGGGACTVEVRASINGKVDNLGQVHWQNMEQGEGEDFTYLRAQTASSGINLAMAMRVQASKSPIQEQYLDIEKQPTQVLTFSAAHGEAIQIEKVVAIATSRDTDDPFNLAVERVRKSAGWEEAYAANEAAWREDWERMDVMIEGDDEAQLAMRANLFQLFIAAPRNDERVNIGAKTLSGYGYRGHSFWDTEIYMLPVFIYTAPNIARNLLNYRYARLEAAHQKAKENGFEGAQFPWESADSGEEVTPRWVPDFTGEKSMVRIWTGDIEIHISADIAFAAHLYWKTTGDDAWFIEKGAELVLDTAKFWASRAEWDEQTQRYEYNDVIGPDEYHDHVDNNFYTNYMARWNIKTALEVLQWLEERAPAKAQELEERLELRAEALDQWKDVMERIFLPMGEGGLIEQFEGYFKLRDIDLAGLEPRKISTQEYFGIEGVSKTQIIKQPDVLMLLYLMRDEFSDEQVRMNYDYYTPRTDVTFGSSLGPSIMAALTCRMRDCAAAFEYFIRAANADMKDVRGNAGDGIHGASAGGLWQSVVFGFAGLEVGEQGWEVHPCLPARWKRLTFHFTYHGKVETVDITNP